MNLYLVRHGQSVPNATNRHSGWTMLPLTEKGFDDARRAGEKLKGIPFDRIYSSDLTRAVQTAQTALPGCEPIRLPLIRERSVGCLMEKPIPECHAEFGETYATARATLDFTPFGGESPDMVRARAAEFLRMLEADPAENIAAFIHAGLMRHFLELALGTTFNVTGLAIANGAVLHLDYNGNHWRFILE